MIIMILRLVRIFIIFILASCLSICGLVQSPIPLRVSGSAYMLTPLSSVVQHTCLFHYYQWFSLHAYSTITSGSAFMPNPLPCSSQHLLHLYHICVVVIVLQNVFSSPHQVGVSSANLTHFHLY